MEMKRELASSFDKDSVVPDGLFVANVNGENVVVALELEMHAKSHKRYKNIFKEYTYRDAITHIFYVVKDISITKPIMKVWVERDSRISRYCKQKLIACVYDELINDFQFAKIYFANGQ